MPTHDRLQGVVQDKKRAIDFLNIVSIAMDSQDGVGREFQRPREFSEGRMMFFPSTISATFFSPQQSSLDFAPTFLDLITFDQDYVRRRPRYVLLTSTVSAPRGFRSTFAGNKDLHRLRIFLSYRSLDNYRWACGRGLSNVIISTSKERVFAWLSGKGSVGTSVVMQRALFYQRT